MPVMALAMVAEQPRLRHLKVSLDLTRTAGASFARQVCLVAVLDLASC
ncbi:MAG TPA: hypothetical protein VM925_31065 [Labilithrix sp.]|nr:hypothetical protein [Labilithrix sp.]